MPTSAAQLRAALEDALGHPVEMFPSQRGSRLSAAAPAGDDWARWRKVIDAMQAADSWGSSDTGATPQIWAEVSET